MADKSPVAPGKLHLAEDGWKGLAPQMNLFKKTNECHTVVHRIQVGNRKCWGSCNCSDSRANKWLGKSEFVFLSRGRTHKWCNFDRTSQRYIYKHQAGSDKYPVDNQRGRRLCKMTENYHELSKSKTSSAQSSSPALGAIAGVRCRAVTIDTGARANS
jgi:hypothetical protein